MDRHIIEGTWHAKEEIITQYGDDDDKRMKPHGNSVKMNASQIDNLKSIVDVIAVASFAPKN